MADQSSQSKSSPSNAIHEKGLERMEALMKQSAMGIHILFQKEEIIEALKKTSPQHDLFDFKKMKKVQDVMSELISRQSFYEKMEYLRDLDLDSYHLLIRTYFHIVENTVRASADHAH